MLDRKISPGQPSPVTLTRSSLTFKPIPIASTQPDQESVGLMNNQSVNLNIQSVTVSGAGYSLSTSLTPCTGSLAPGAGCVIAVQFDPTATGSQPGTVTVTDDGGSSGRLRRELKMLPPGDVRNCLVALAEDDELLTRLFAYRLPGNGPTGGHPLGMLAGAALPDVGQLTAQAGRIASDIATISSRVQDAFDSTSAERLKGAGYRRPLQITQCGGGSISVDKAMLEPLLTLDSGPVSGVTGSVYLGQVMGIDNIITTDMGGTSFDVGIVHGGRPQYSFVSNVAQYEYFLPKVDIQAIGSGGGKKAIVDGTVDFAGSDSVLKPDEVTAGKDLQMYPMVAGAVVPVYNVANHNDSTCRELLEAEKPDVLVLGGTRIIKPNIMLAIYGVGNAIIILLAIFGLIAAFIISLFS